MKAENEAYLAQVEEKAYIRAQVVERLDRVGIVVTSVVVDTRTPMGNPLEHPAIEVRGSIIALALHTGDSAPNEGR